MSEQDPEVTIPSKPASPDPEHFYELISTKTRHGHHISQPGTPSTPIYTIETSESPSRSKPSIKLHHGNSKSGPVLGVVKIGLSGEQAIGIGDPDAIWEDGGSKADRITWERLCKASKFSYMTYRFEYESGDTERRERRTFTWRKVKREPFWNVQRDMELRVGAGEGGDGDGEVLAVWKRTDWKNMKRGVFFIRRREAGEEEGMGDGNETKRWELMVLLTALGIVEAATRRG